MAKVELIMPKMGESIIEATILNWTKQVGDPIEMDDTVLEIATDKVDSEVPSPVDGVLTEILFQVDDVVPVGTVIARIETEGAEVAASPAVKEEETAPTAKSTVAKETNTPSPQPATAGNDYSSTERFYSPLVKNIAKKENISVAELDAIQGSGAQGRVTKHDMIAYLDNRMPETPSNRPVTQSAQNRPAPLLTSNGAAMSVSGADEIIEMDRMRKLIAEHMVMSKRVSPHVTSFVEADVTNIFNWRKRNKNAFLEKYGTKITFTPIFMEAIAKAIRDFPMINVSVDGTKIIVKKDINIGMAAALPNNNLIVPVIKNADRLNLAGLATAVNDLAVRARNNKLKPDEVQGGTFTMTNVGTFGNVMGVPIINQPQVAIMSVGTITKKPAVVETQYGDVIAIRHKMFLSMSYDHRVVDGYLGGSFIKRVSDYLEAFDENMEL